MKKTFLNFITAIGLLFMGGLINGQSCCFEDETTVGIENEFCRIVFDRETGSLLKLTRLPDGDEYLKGEKKGEGMPFRIYRDMIKEFELEDDASMISRNILRPGDCKLVDIDKEDGLSLTYQGPGRELELVLHVRLEEGQGTSEWTLQVNSTKQHIQELMISFPCFEGVVLGPDSTTNLQTSHQDGDSTILPAWSDYGKVPMPLIMQWHALWDPPSGSAFSLIFKDAEPLPKKLFLNKKNIELLYFPPIDLPPGSSYTLPAAKVLVYKGSWRPSARAYHKWFSQAIDCVTPPEWFVNSDSWDGRHVAHGIEPPEDAGVIVLDSFRDLDKATIHVPFDNTEYAFYCRGSMFYHTHEDGINEVREDLGGAEAFRQGIARIRRLGLHTTLYIDAYIVPTKSELIQSGQALPWRIMEKDGTYDGFYIKAKWGGGCNHMCIGCKAWQDHQAKTVARLLRETGADGIRIDSLGRFFRPCYNPEHYHSSPFDFYKWTKEFLTKVHRAAMEVNPNALLTTEGSVDWFGQWLHGALNQKYPRDLPPIRLAVGPYRPYAYAQAGPVWGSLSGLAGGRTCWKLEMEPLETNWLSARFGAHHTLVWGDVADDDPTASNPEIVTRCFKSDNHWAVVAARPECQELVWPAYTGLSDKRGDYTLTVNDLPSPVKQAYVCDIETLQWSPLDFQQQDNSLWLKSKSNWVMAILIIDDNFTMAGFDPLPTLHPGESTEVKLDFISNDQKTKTPLTAVIESAGLTISPSRITLPATVTIHVPSDALPGLYAVKLSGDNLLGFKRFLKVE